MSRSELTIEKYTLITGASTGIGRALAEECARLRRNLFLVALPDSGLEETCSHLSAAYGINTMYLETDLTEKNATRQIAEFSYRNNLSVDFLINNAGIGFDGAFENHTQENIDKMISLNIRAVTSLTNYFIAELKSQPVAYILNVSSFGSFLPTPYKSIYLASKSYVYFFSEALRHELSDSPVKVFTLLPGGVRTNEAVCKRIDKAGYFGKLTSMEAEKVASYAMRKVQKGQSIIIPGKANMGVFYTFRLLPMGLVQYMIKNLFHAKTGE